MSLTTQEKRQILRKLTGWVLSESTHSDRQIEAIWRKLKPRKETKLVGIETRWEFGYPYEIAVVEERWVLN